MVNQYPYNLEIIKGGSDSVFDENTGSWTPADDVFATVSKCRDDYGGGGKITTEDGELYEFGAIIYLPKGSVELSNGDRIRVTDDLNNVRISGVVKSFSNGFFNSRIWI